LRYDYKEMIAFRAGIFAKILSKKLGENIGIYISDQYLKLVFISNKSTLNKNKFVIEEMIQDIVNSKHLDQSLEKTLLSLNIVPEDLEETNFESDKFIYFGQ